MELKLIWGIIWRRKWVIIQAFLIIFLAIMIGTFLRTPIYQATAKILIKMTDSESDLLSSIGLQDVRSGVNTEEFKKENNIAIATSIPILERVITNLQLTGKEGDLLSYEDLIEKNIIKEAIIPEPYVKVNLIEDSDLIEIVAESTDPEEAAMIANTIAEECISENLRIKKEEYKTARNYVEKQIDSIKAKYLKVLGNIKNFQINEKSIDVGYEKKEAVERMSSMMKEKESYIINISEIRAKLKKLEVQLSKQNEKNVSSSSINENRYIENLKNTIIELELQLEEELPEKTKEHPDIVILNQKLKKIKGELKKEIDLIKISSSRLEDMERDLAASETHLQSLDVEIDKYMDIFYTLPGKIFSDAQLNLDFEVNEELYRSLLEYLYQIGVAESFSVSDIRLIEAAPVPEIDKPKRPLMLLNAVLGIILGLTVGFILGFLVDYLDDTIRSPEEVQELGFVLLGIVQRFKRKDSSLISERDRRDPVCESYRTIRNSVKFASVDDPIKSLLITSSMASEGKTTTAINLGLSIVYEGKKVLIVDTDLRHPSVHVALKRPNTIGITDVLSLQEKADNAIQKTDIEGLSILTSGPIPPDPARLVESEKMRRLIKELSEQYDMVILDSPPIFVGNDAVVLAGYADACISILESGRETHRIINQKKEIMKLANIELLGVILNKYRMEGIGSHYYYNYNYY